MFTATLGPSLLENMLAGNWEQCVMKADEGANVSGQDFEYRLIL